MSSVFIINLKNHILSYEKMNEFANNLVKIALQENIGVFFNSYDYANDLIEDANMNDFLTLSDSFLYKNCDFLDTSLFDVSSKSDFKKSFIDKFKFIDRILDEIEKNDILNIEIFISCDGSVNEVSDFKNEKTTKTEFLNSLFNSIIKYSYKYAYGFPTIKFDISFDSKETRRQGTEETVAEP